MGAYLHRERPNRAPNPSRKPHNCSLPRFLPTQWMSLCRQESSSCRTPRLSNVHCCLLHWLAIFYRSCVAGTSTGRGSGGRDGLRPLRGGPVGPTAVNAPAIAADSSNLFLRPESPCHFILSIIYDGAGSWRRLGVLKANTRCFSGSDWF